MAMLNAPESGAVCLIGYLLSVRASHEMSDQRQSKQRNQEPTCKGIFNQFGN